MPTFRFLDFRSLGFEPALDQPNRAVRTRMLRGVGGGSCKQWHSFLPYSKFIHPDQQRNYLS